MIWMAPFALCPLFPDLDDLPDYQADDDLLSDVAEADGMDEDGDGESAVADQNEFYIVESEMCNLAPNLSAVVGISVASKLIAAGGGLSVLARMPAHDVQFLGVKKNNVIGLSQLQIGYIGQSKIFQMTPPPLAMRAGRLLAAKSMLAARVDSIGSDPTGEIGENIKEEIQKKIAKWRQQTPA